MVKVHNKPVNNANDWKSFLIYLTFLQLQDSSKMFGAIRDFFRRHRRKFIVAGVVTGGAVLLWKYAEWKLDEWREKEAAECLAMARRQHHFDSNQRTCNLTVLSMLPKLKETLLELLDSEKLIAELKSRPENKVAIWNELKITCFCRTVTCVYSTVLLVVFLRVQLNIIGGYMYLDSLSGKNGFTNGRIHATPDVQKRYLATVQNLLSDGLSDLISTVHQAVRNVMQGMPLQKLLSLQDIERLFGSIRCQVETTKVGEGITDNIHPLSRYLLASEVGEGESSACQLSQDDLMFNKLMAETRDMIESSDFQTVLNTCLDIGFSRVLDNMAEFFRPSLAAGGDSQDFGPTCIHLALAKVIPVVNGQINVICGEAPNHFIQEMLLMQCVKDFAANVYEAFSQPIMDPAHGP
ncbi:LOW QUALITY PROTEIN: peroxisomal biogenesis factor 3-like [Amphiura filiformis]|uniref:LOW QUALITY PROTEIN: peroxisomal biogenesis factor 3-like n=1 Tax=Amphiura filiformis TaxID=82378 RepID=UPI003B21767F